MDHEHNFVVSHSRTPYGLQPPVTRCGKEDEPVARPGQILRGGVYKGLCRFAMGQFGTCFSAVKTLKTPLPHRLKQTYTRCDRYIEA